MLRATCRAINRQGNPLIEERWVKHASMSTVCRGATAPMCAMAAEAAKARGHAVVVLHGLEHIASRLTP